jgi:hypothetical protein
MKAPKLSEKMKHLQLFFESQPIELQWTMQNKSKSMFGFKKDIHKKTNSLTYHKDATYQDKHNNNAEERSTKKISVKSSLRIKPLLMSSSTITTSA